MGLMEACLQADTIQAGDGSTAVLLSQQINYLREIKNRFRLFTRSLARQGKGGSFKNSKKNKENEKGKLEVRHSDDYCYPYCDSHQLRCYKLHELRKNASEFPEAFSDFNIQLNSKR